MSAGSGFLLLRAVSERDTVLAPRAQRALLGAPSPCPSRGWRGQLAPLGPKSEYGLRAHGDPVSPVVPFQCRLACSLFLSLSPPGARGCRPQVRDFLPDPSAVVPATLRFLDAPHWALGAGRLHPGPSPNEALSPCCCGLAAPRPCPGPPHSQLMQGTDVCTPGTSTCCRHGPSRNRALP